MRPAAAGLKAHSAHFLPTSAFHQAQHIFDADLIVHCEIAKALRLLGDSLDDSVRDTKNTWSKRCLYDAEVCVVFAALGTACACVRACVRALLRRRGCVGEGALTRVRWRGCVGERARASKRAWEGVRMCTRMRARACVNVRACVHACAHRRRKHWVLLERRRDCRLLGIEAGLPSNMVEMQDRLRTDQVRDRKWKLVRDRLGNGRNERPDQRLGDDHLYANRITPSVSGRSSWITPDWNGSSCLLLYRLLLSGPELSRLYLSYRTRASPTTILPISLANLTVSPTRDLARDHLAEPNRTPRLHFATISPHLAAISPLISRPSRGHLAPRA
eukprot:5315127-Pleurochrysis_carterae.AAC.1